MDTQKTRCEVLIESEWCGIPQYNPCNRPAKYKVQYKDVRSKKKTKIVCGIHYNSFKAGSKRLLKKLGFNIELKILKSFK